MIIIHHPPVKNAAAPHKRLNGQSLFRRVVARHGAELVLHGHTHVDSIHRIAGKERPVAVVGVPSGAQAPLEKVRKPAARYNLFDIARKDEDWSIEMTEYGYAGPGVGVDEIARLRIL